LTLSQADSGIVLRLPVLRIQELVTLTTAE